MVYEEELNDHRKKRYEVKMVEMSLLGNHTFHHPSEFTGEAEHFEEFSYNLHAYMSLLNPGNSQIFKRVEADPTHTIHYEDLHEIQPVRAEGGTLTQFVVTKTHLAVLASSLQNVLTTLCTCDGSTLLRMGYYNERRRKLEKALRTIQSAYTSESGRKPHENPSD